MGEVVSISTRAEALKHADGWQRHAQRLEILLLVATAQWKSSDLLLRIAEEEIARLKKLLV